MIAKRGKTRDRRAPIPTTTPLNELSEEKKFGRGRSRGSKSNMGQAWETYRELAPESVSYSLKAANALVRKGNTGSFLASFRLGFDAALTTDGSGILASVFANSPTSAQNWSGYAGVFDEYRVLAMEVKFEPLVSTGGATATFWAPIARVVDRSDATPLTGYGLAERFDSHKKAPGREKWKSSWVMNSVEEATFTSTTSSAPTAWVKIYSSGNSASYTVGRMDVVYIVQFRGLGIN